MDKDKVMLFIPFLALAGAEMMVKDLAVGLTQEGCTVIVVSLYKFESAITEDLNKRGIRLVFLNKRKGIDIRLFFKAYKLIKMEKPDIVHTHLNIVKYIIPCAIMNKTKCLVHTVHNIAKKEQGKMDRIITGFFARHFNLKLIGITPTVQSSIASEYNISIERIPMVYNGRDLKQFQLPKHYSEKNTIEFLHVGRFTEQKNHKMMIEAFANALKRNNNMSLSLVGDGALVDTVKMQVRALDIEDHVKFLGLRTDIYKLMNKADVFLLPSIYEGMPITLIEAMASGMPIIASNVGGVADIIDDKTSILISIDKYELTETILKIAESSKLRQKLGTNARKQSLSFSNEKMAKEYMKVYFD